MDNKEHTSLSTTSRSRLANVTCSEVENAASDSASKESDLIASALHPIYQLGFIHGFMKGVDWIIARLKDE